MRGLRLPSLLRSGKEPGIAGNLRTSQCDLNAELQPLDVSHHMSAVIPSAARKLSGLMASSCYQEAPALRSLAALGMTRSEARQLPSNDFPATSLAGQANAATGRRQNGQGVGKLVAAAALLALTPLTYAQEQSRQDPPDFTSGYALPSPTAPGPRADLFGYIDVAVLMLVMALCAFFLLRKRSRREIQVLSIFSLLYFGFYRLGCVCSVGSVQNIALALGDNKYAVPFTVMAFFLLPLVFTLFFGRVFCGSACPLGAMQDLVAFKPRKVHPGLDRGLGILPYVWLAIGVFFAYEGAAFFICEYDPFVGFFRLSMRSGVFWVSIVFLVLSVFVGRPYCRFLCPYGGLLRLINPLAKWKVSITPNECINCHLCAEACPFGSIQPPTSASEDLNRPKARKHLAWAVLSVPILAVLFAGIAYWAAPALASQHLTVAKAKVVWEEGKQPSEKTPDKLRAWRNTGRPEGELYFEALKVKNKFQEDAPYLGGFIGLIIGLSLVSAARIRKRTQYLADEGCVSCGRCYSSCPVEQARVNPDLAPRLEQLKKELRVLP